MIEYAFDSAIQFHKESNLGFLGITETTRKRGS